MTDLQEYAGASRRDEGWGALKEFDYLQDVPQTNLFLWWKIDSITNAADGDAIQTLTNEMGLGNPTQGTLANRAIYRTNAINGMPALEFDGVNDSYINTALAAYMTGADQPFTIYIVCTLLTTGLPNTYFSVGRSATTNTSFRIGKRAGGASNTYNATKADDAAASASVDSVGAHSTSPIVRVENSPGTTANLWVNNTQLITAATFNVGTFTVDRLVIGAAYINGVTSSFTNIQISEILAYDVSHTTATRELITNYLKNKYKLYV